MATQSASTIAPKADQPRATTQSLQRNESAPSLTQRTTGIKNYARNGRRDYSRK